MEAKNVKLLRDTVGTIVNLLKGVNINQKAIDEHTPQINALRKKMDDYQKQYSDKEYMEKLSPAEKQNLMQNANMFYQTYDELAKEMDYLDMTKHPLFLGNCIKALERSYLMFDYLLRFQYGESGEVVLAKLLCIKAKEAKDFYKATYIQQINTLFSEIEAWTHDIYVDYIEKSDSDTPLIIYFINAHTLLAESLMWIEKEKERMTVEAMPEIRKVNIPDEVPLAVPKGPADMKVVKGEKEEGEKAEA
jgi:hypothetical protein